MVVANETERKRPPILSVAERKAYQAAWRIMQGKPAEDVNGLVCASAKRSREVDRIAKIIKEEMGL
jgi:hypothetical protein